MGMIIVLCLLFGWCFYLSLKLGMMKQENRVADEKISLIHSDIESHEESLWSLIEVGHQQNKSLDVLAKKINSLSDDYADHKESVVDFIVSIADSVNEGEDPSFLEPVVKVDKGKLN